MNLVAEAAGFNQPVPLTFSIDLAEDRADFFVSIYQAGISGCVPGKTSPHAAASRCLREYGRIRPWNKRP
jgi:hypothetical protein